MIESSRFASGLVATSTSLALLFAGIAPAAAQGSGISHQFLAGSWQEDPFCRGAEIFAFDGSGTARQGTSTLNYAISRPDEVLFYGSGGNAPMRAHANTAGSMQVTLGGMTGMVYRCSTSFAGVTPPTSGGGGSGTSAAAGVAALAIIGGLAALAASAQTAPAPATVVASGAPPLSVQFMIGRWTDNGNCSDATTFLGNGEVFTAAGGQANWALSGSDLIVTGGGGTVRAQLQPISQDSINARSGGTRSVMVRCP